MKCQKCENKAEYWTINGGFDGKQEIILCEKHFKELDYDTQGKFNRW